LVNDGEYGARCDLDGESECVDVVRQGSNRVVRFPESSLLSVCLRLESIRANGVRHPSQLVEPAVRNCTSDVRSANSKHWTQFPIESSPLDLSFLDSPRSPTSKMRSTAALRMFRQTPRMLRPVPVSIPVSMAERTSSLALGSV
jgi:hypothetical protein